MAITVAIVEDVRETRARTWSRFFCEARMAFRFSRHTPMPRMQCGIPVQRPNVAAGRHPAASHEAASIALRSSKPQMPELEVLMVTTYEEPDLIFNFSAREQKGMC